MNSQNLERRNFSTALNFAYQRVTRLLSCQSRLPAISTHEANIRVIFLISRCILMLVWKIHKLENLTAEHFFAPLVIKLKLITIISHSQAVSLNRYRMSCHILLLPTPTNDNFFRVEVERERFYYSAFWPQKKIPMTRYFYCYQRNFLLLFPLAQTFKA